MAAIQTQVETKPRAAEHALVHAASEASPAQAEDGLFERVVSSSKVRAVSSIERRYGRAACQLARRSRIVLVEQAGRERASYGGRSWPAL